MMKGVLNVFRWFGHIEKIGKDMVAKKVCGRVYGKSFGSWVTEEVD